MKLFETDKTESRQSWIRRVAINFWPCITCSGGRVRFISSDYRELHVSLGLNLLTRNRVGTIYGGSLYSAIDPYFMLMLIQILGKEYVVWDKAASIKFLRPAKTDLRCRFLLDEELIQFIKTQVEHKGEYSFDLPLKFEDKRGRAFAVFKKTMYVARKDFYLHKVKQRPK